MCLVLNGSVRHFDVALLWTFADHDDLTLTVRYRSLITRSKVSQVQYSQGFYSQLNTNKLKQSICQQRSPSNCQTVNQYENTWNLSTFDLNSLLSHALKRACSKYVSVNVYTCNAIRRLYIMLSFLEVEGQSLLLYCNISDVSM